MQDLTTFITNHQLLTALTATAIALAIIVELLRAKRKSIGVTAAQAILLINHDNAVVIDIRPVETYRKGHIIDAKSIPANELSENFKKVEKFKTRPLILVCTTGIEAQKLAASLLKQGYNAFSLAGGMRAWSEAQMPLVKE
jgi:rhodanese-related sulfurtransferase